MDLPSPPQAVAALAAFLRARLSELPGPLSSGWNRGDGRAAPPESVVGAARQLALVIVGAAAPFAPTSYSRARLIRQMHASGLLTDEHVRTTRTLLELDAGGGDSGAPR